MEREDLDPAGFAVWLLWNDLQQGRPEDATAAYRRFAAAWEDADPRLLPRVEEARERARQLGGAAR